jgi:hypothetical protein
MMRDLFGFCLGKLMELVFPRLILGLFHYTDSTADVTGHTLSRKDKPKKGISKGRGLNYSVSECTGEFACRN